MHYLRARVAAHLALQPDVVVLRKVEFPYLGGELVVVEGDAPCEGQLAHLLVEMLVGFAGQNVEYGGAVNVLLANIKPDVERLNPVEHVQLGNGRGVVKHFGHAQIDLAVHRGNRFLAVVHDHPITPVERPWLVFGRLEALDGPREAGHLAHHEVDEHQLEEARARAIQAKRQEELKRQRDLAASNQNSSFINSLFTKNKKKAS